jgi:hypothetical protein
MITAHGTLYLKALEFPKGTPVFIKMLLHGPSPSLPSTTNNIYKKTALLDTISLLQIIINYWALIHI